MSDEEPKREDLYDIIFDEKVECHTFEMGCPLCNHDVKLCTILDSKNKIKHQFYRCFCPNEEGEFYVDFLIKNYQKVID